MDDWGLYDRDVGADPICPECERELDWIECDQCRGTGVFGHDCGEDCCACLYPEENDPCALCGGAAGWHVCANPQCEIQVVA